MSVFLTLERQKLNGNVSKLKTIQNLHNSKKIRCKRRLRTLLLSKRGLSTAFIAGMVKEWVQDDSDASSKTSAKTTRSIAKLGLSAWFSGA
jgi:hypothetical protein